VPGIEMDKVIRIIAMAILLVHLAGLANLNLRTDALFRQYDKLEAAFVPWMMLSHCIAFAGGVVVLRKMPGGMSLIGLGTLGATSLSLSAEFSALQSWIWVALFVALAIPVVARASNEQD